MDAISFDDGKVRDHIANLRIDPAFDDEPPTSKLAFTLGTLHSWCSTVTKKLEQRSHERLPALEADEHAARHDEELGRRK